jgi:hypothetical protein
MELVDRYILAVKQSLPADKGDEIGRELKANILDEVDALNAENASIDEAVNQVLNKYGHPDTTANRFYSRPALVSGIDMPLYKKVLVHSAAFLFAYAVVRTLFSMIQHDSINPIRLLLQPLGLFVENLSLLFLIVTLSFYYIGKNGSISAWLYRNWSLSKLPVNPSFKISNSDTITDIITNSFLLLILWTHLWMSEDVYQQQILAIAPAAEHWRYILTVLSLQSLIQALYRLTQIHWQRGSYIAYMIDHALFAVAAVWMALTAPIVVMKDTINENLPAFVLTFIDTSQSYFLLSVALILFVLLYFQIKKFPDLK